MIIGLFVGPIIVSYMYDNINAIDELKMKIKVDTMTGHVDGKEKFGDTS